MWGIFVCKLATLAVLANSQDQKQAKTHSIKQLEKRV